MKPGGTPSERVARIASATTFWMGLPAPLRTVIGEIGGTRVQTGSGLKSTRSRAKRDPAFYERRSRRMRRKRAIVMRSTYSRANAAGILIDDVKIDQSLSDHTAARALGITQRELRLQQQETLKPIIEAKLERKAVLDAAVSRLRHARRRIRLAAPPSLEQDVRTAGVLDELLGHAGRLFRRRRAA